MDVAMLDDLQRVLIVGPGALGAMLGAKLARLGIDTRYLGRQGLVAARFAVEDGGDVCDVVALAPDRSWLAAVDLVFVAVKAFDLAEALDQALDLTPARAVVLPVTNGEVEGLVRAASARHPERVLRRGFCTIGVTASKAGRFAVRSVGGDISFGPLSRGEVMTTAEAALTAPPSVFVWHANIEKLQRRKWIYNVVINSMTAASGLKRNGDLLHDLPSVTAVFHEACDLATALWGALPQERAELFAGMIQLIERTGDNENSMARDVRLGRRTESGYLAGIATDARRYPRLCALHAKIGGGL